MSPIKLLEGEETTDVNESYVIQQQQSDDYTES